METIHVCVGTDQRMGRAEKVLEHSIRRSTEAEVEMHWMRAGDEGWTDWASQLKHPHRASATYFSVFRFCVPEVLGFEGYGIYLDADMIVLGDIKELYGYREQGKWSSVGGHMPVGVIDCTRRTGITMDQMRRQKFYTQDLMRTVPIEAGIPGDWNSCDILHANTKLLHFTDIETQPWHPWPEELAYATPHPCQRAVDLFFDLEEECA